MKPTLHSFTTTLQPMEGVYTSSCIVVPNEVVKKLPNATRLRTTGTLNTAPFALAIQRRANGVSLIIVSKRLRTEAKVSIGDTVQVTFEVVPTEQIEMPEELQALLDVDADAAEFWGSLTIGMQRSYAYYIGGAKTIDTRIRRSIDIITRGMNGELHAQKNAQKKK